MILTATTTEIVTDKAAWNLFTGIALAIVVSVLGLLVWVYQRFITKIDEATTNQVQTRTILENLLKELRDLKKGIEKIPEIQTQLSNTSIIVQHIQDQMNDYKKSAYDNSRDIMSLRDDITHILKEIKK